MVVLSHPAIHIDPVFSFQSAGVSPSCFISLDPPVLFFQSQWRLAACSPRATHACVISLEKQLKPRNMVPF